MDDYREAGGRDRSASRAKKALENATDKVGEQLQKAGRKVENAAGAVGERIEKTASSVQHAIRNHVPAPAQAIFGAAVGGLAGYMDNNFVEPFGQIMGTTLLGLQLLDHEGVVSLPWNNATIPSNHGAHSAISRSRSAGFVPALQCVGQEVVDFAANNIYIVAGFTGGYILAKNVLQN